MMREFDKKTCPRCGAARIKEWNELTDEQKFLVERLPLSAEHSLAERKRHRWCVKCWYEFAEREANLA